MNMRIIARDKTYLPDRPLVVKSQSFVSIACRQEYADARDIAAHDAKRIGGFRSVWL